MGTRRPEYESLGIAYGFSWYARSAMGDLAAKMLVLLLLGACQRTDNSGPLEPAKQAEAPAAVKEPAPTCVVALAEPPPTQSKPAATCPKAPSDGEALPRGTVKFLGGSQSSVEVELAVTGEQQQRGLMYRTVLGTESGMLFSWQNESIHTFWMHNTCIPLDMLFITADGTIAGILEQVPVLNDDPRSIPCPTAHVLEVNAGYCRQHGIQPGQRVRIRANSG